MSDAEAVRQWASYEPTGHLVSTRTGKRLGSVNSRGYLTCRFGGKTHKVHRLVWLHQRGQWPELHIDHINGNRQDNRIENLRDVSRTVNNQNQIRPHADGTNKLIGVHWDKRCQRYLTQIHHQGKNVFLGRFDTAEEAQAVYLKHKREWHEGNTL